MKKRLRKKLRLREFQEMCFSVRLTFAIEEDSKRESFWYSLVEMVEANELLILGMADDFCVMTNFYRMPNGLWKTAIEADRQTMRAWLQQQPEVKTFMIGPLANAWRELPPEAE